MVRDAIKRGAYKKAKQLLKDHVDEAFGMFRESLVSYLHDLEEGQDHAKAPNRVTFL
jgi:hypothetical protein